MKGTIAKNASQHVPMLLFQYALEKLKSTILGIHLQTLCPLDSVTAVMAGDVLLFGLVFSNGFPNVFGSST